ncbi:pyridoxal-phosphate dependent enzyme [Afifella sp. JA880]|uniref:pyridoxal-phosphate dependent enzyme n=1 Tax=Afifella sp. JA880 TaxID=2975280 RepID=UPI0039647F94
MGCRDGDWRPKFRRGRCRRTRLCREDRALYFHSFADPLITAGQRTAGLEIFDNLPDIETLVIAVVGGGFITGIAVALKALKPAI